MSLFSSVFPNKPKLTSQQAYQIAYNAIDYTQLNEFPINVKRFRYYENLEGEYSDTEIGNVMRNGRKFGALLIASSVIVINYSKKAKVSIDAEDEKWNALNNDDFIRGFIDLLISDLEKLDNPINSDIASDVYDGESYYAEASNNYLILNYMLYVRNGIEKMTNELQSNPIEAGKELAYNLLYKPGILAYEIDNPWNDFKIPHLDTDILFTLPFLGKMITTTLTEIRKYNI